MKTLYKKGDPYKNKQKPLYENEDPPLKWTPAYKNREPLLK